MSVTVNSEERIQFLVPGELWSPKEKLTCHGPWARTPDSGSVTKKKYLTDPRQLTLVVPEETASGLGSDGRSRGWGVAQLVRYLSITMKQWV